MKKYQYQSPVVQALLCISIPFGLLGCSSGSNGTTPIVTVIGAECTTSFQDLKINIKNSFNVDARIGEYTDNESIIPTQNPGIYCVSGEQSWSNLSPVIVEANSTVTASLSCGSSAPSSNYVGCNVESSQPIECYINASMDSPTQSLGAINISTIRCVEIMNNSIVAKTRK